MDGPGPPETLVLRSGAEIDIYPESIKYSLPRPLGRISRYNLRDDVQ